MTASELRRQRATLINQARGILDSAQAAKREPTAEENARFDMIMAEADKCEARYLKIEKLEAAEKTVAESRGRQLNGEEPGRQPGDDRGPDHRGSTEYRSLFIRFLRDGIGSLGAAETRSLAAEGDTVGGYLVAPQQLTSDFVKSLDNAVVIRQLATKFSVGSAQSLGAPSLDADPDDAEWTSELQTGNEDNSTAFGKRELHPHALAKRIKVSNKLLRLLPGIEDFIRQRLAYKFAVTEEKAFLTGDGVSKPLGVFTASTNGISTARDVPADNTTTAITADGLINAKYSLKEQYMKSPSLRWMFHRDAIKMIRKLKDGNSQYIWQPGLQAGQPNMILDVPVVMSEYSPNTFTAGKYVGIIGDFSYYWIADAQTLMFQRLVELYAESNQTGFIGRQEVDGMPVLEEAFARVTLAAS